MMSKGDGSLCQQVVEELGLAIVAGQLKAGETLLKEAELSEQLGVSRTITREAIKILSDKGLVSVRRKTGTEVLSSESWRHVDRDVLRWQFEAGPSQTFLMNILQVRLAIEPAAAAAAAINATDKEIAKIATAYWQMELFVDDMTKYVPVDLQFHASIFAASHNPILEQLATDIRYGLLAGRNVQAQLPDAAKDGMPFHRAVMDAITKREAQGAEKAMRELIDRAHQHTQEALDRSKQETGEEQQFQDTQ